MWKFSPLLLRVAALVLLGACQEARRERPLLVSAAASLKEVMEELGRAFAAEPGGCPVTFQFGASGELERQILGGAPVDVFVSAATEQMDRLEKAGRVAALSRRALASNRLVLIAPRGSPLRGGAALTALLTDQGVARIALGEPATVPAGAYARKALDALSLWEQLEPRLVTGANVRQVLDLVGRREVELGFVYETDLRGRGDVVKIAELPAAPEISYPIAVLEGAARPEAAEAFVRFVTGPRGREILARHGFLPPP